MGTRAQAPDSSRTTHLPPSLTHTAKNVALLATLLSFLPISTSVVAFSYAASILVPQNCLRRRIRQSRRFRPKTVLITGVGTAQGLRIARAFYETGHDVIGADFAVANIPVNARFSKALKKFYRLRSPNERAGATRYLQDLINIVETEQVDLWVSCTSQVSATEEGQAGELLEHRTNCKSLQIDAASAGVLGDEDGFVRYASSIGLPTPETHEVRSRAAVHDVLNQANGRKQYTMKAIAEPNAVKKKPSRHMLPRRTLSQTYNHVSTIKISKDQPYVLQQYITGEEYKTCSIIVDGELKAFVACPAAQSPGLQALPTSSGVGKAMLNFVKTFIIKSSTPYTGHLSFNFLVEEIATERGIQQDILPIDCSPRTSSSLILFATPRGSIDLVRAYLEALPPSAEGINGFSGLTDANYSPGDVAVPSSTAPGLYFSGQDLISLVMYPLLQLLTFKIGLLQFVHHCVTFLNHLLFWQEGTFQIWDPLPWFWLYHVYIPVQLLGSIWLGKNWSSIDLAQGTLAYIEEYVTHFPDKPS